MYRELNSAPLDDEPRYGRSEIKHAGIVGARLRARMSLEVMLRVPLPKQIDGRRHVAAAKWCANQGLAANPRYAACSHAAGVSLVVRLAKRAAAR